MSIDKKNINFKDFTKSHEYNYKEEEKKKIRLIIVSGSLALVSFLLIVLPYRILFYLGMAYLFIQQ